MTNVALSLVSSAMFTEEEVFDTGYDRYQVITNCQPHRLLPFVSNIFSFRSHKNLFFLFSMRM